MKKSDEGSLTLGTKKFQQKTKRWKVTILQKKFIYDNFVDKQKLGLKENLVEKRSCPMGSSICKNSFVLFKKDFFTYNKCSKCNLIYVSPALKEKKLMKLYKNSSYSNSWGKILANKTEVKFNQNKFNSLIKDIKKIKNINYKVLDIGCANGQFLDACKASGWDTYGLELNDSERKEALKKGHIVYNSKIHSNFVKKESFDLITMLEVLEHVHNPAKVIKNIWKALKPNGLIVIIVPNVDSLASNIMQSRCNMFLGMSHITMFDPNTLKNFMYKHSFKQVFCTTITSELSVINNYLNMQDPYLGNAKIKSPLLKKWNDKNILKKMKGYKIKAIFKKI